ncbi:hypothetical protein BUE80_DR000044, partial [Diplocarpon rosae]
FFEIAYTFHQATLHFPLDWRISFSPSGSPQAQTTITSLISATPNNLLVCFISLHLSLLLPVGDY